MQPKHSNPCESLRSNHSTPDTYVVMKDVRDAKSAGPDVGASASATVAV